MFTFDLFSVCHSHSQSVPVSLYLRNIAFDRKYYFIYMYISFFALNVDFVNLKKNEP